MVCGRLKNNNSLFWAYVSIYVLSSFFLWNGTGLSGLFDRDPVAETQTKAVPATEETIKNSGKGAPAPTFKIVQDTSKFFVEKPYYEEMEQKKKSNWSFWWDQDKNKSQVKDGQQDTNSSLEGELSPDPLL